MSWKSSRARVVKSSRSSGPPAVSQARAALTTRRVSVAVVSFTAFILAVGLALGGAASATPSSPTDETKVPHYFGPYPNWANSPLALPDATVTINGNGAGAQATATVGANGAVTGLTITDPGERLHGRHGRVLQAPGSGATATAVVQRSGAVNRVTLDQGGQAGTRRRPSRSAAAARRREATAHVLGGVDAVTLVDARQRLHVPDGRIRPAGRSERGRRRRATRRALSYPDCNLTNPGDTVTVTGARPRQRWLRLLVRSERRRSWTAPVRPDHASDPAPLHRGDGIVDAHDPVGRARHLRSTDTRRLPREHHRHERHGHAARPRRPRSIRPAASVTR